MNKEKIILGQYENYEANERCIPFCKGTDVKNGIQLKFGNMLSGFPFNVNGINFICSEILYLCGQFSNNNPIHYDIQKELIECNNGFIAKKNVKNKNLCQIRTDFDNFRTEWMLWVVWQKVKGNSDFRELLKSIPDNSIIIEDSSWQTSNTATVWGCKNMEQKRFQLQVKNSIMKENSHLKKCEIDKLYKDEIAKYPLRGVYYGQNNMGKILMLCKIAIENNEEPNIDYDMLRKSNIYLMGEKLF